MVEKILFWALYPRNRRRKELENSTVLNFVRRSKPASESESKKSDKPNQNKQECDENVNYGGTQFLICRDSQLSKMVKQNETGPARKL